VTAVSLNNILDSIQKKYECQICGNSYRTHRQAAECAEECLAQEDRQNVRRVEA